MRKCSGPGAAARLESGKLRPTLALRRRGIMDDGVAHADLISQGLVREEAEVGGPLVQMAPDDRWPATWSSAG